VDLTPGTPVGNWCVIGRLGWGGYGAVYLVRHMREPRRLAALKLALQPGVLSRRLEREAELLKLVKHPHVVRFIEAGHWVVPGSGVHLPFIVMQYVPGLHLYAWASLREARVRETLELFEQSALGLHALHEVDARHRDVKGQNLLVREEDGCLVLVDLGVGDYAGAASLTGTQLPPGSKDYRSPEALRFQREHLGDLEAHYEFRPADDLYALGVTWYRTLTGAHPFEAEGEDSHRARLEGRTPQAPSSLNPRIPPAVGALVLRLLAPRPEERPASAREVAETLATLRRGGGREMEARLFEGNEAATPHSRTTERTPRALTRPWPGWRWGAIVLGAVLATVLFTRSPPTQEGPSMNETKAPASAPPAPDTQWSPREFDFMKSLAAAVCLVTSGCAGVPVKPTWPQDCPPEALDAMAKKGFGPGKQGLVQLDIHNQGILQDFGDYRAGSIVSGIMDSDDAHYLLPLGTKLYGYMWTGGKEVQAYWTEAELPTGQKMPVCMVLGYDERGGYRKRPGTQPGTFKISKAAPMTVTRRFERPE
jgi:serine/threonine-protein kinase